MKDVNNHRYHLLLGPADWSRCQTESSTGRRWEYNPDRHGVQLQAEPLPPPQPGEAIALDPAQRRDSDRDIYGHWYWIDATGTQIQVRWAAAQTTETLYPLPAQTCPPTGDPFYPAQPPAPALPEPLAGLAILPDGYLVVGSPTTGSLLVLDLYALDGGVLRISLDAGAAQSQLPQPFDLAALPTGGLFVLDRVNHRVWRLDRTLRPVPPPASPPRVLSLFQPQMGIPRHDTPVPPPTPIQLHADTIHPGAIAPLPDGSFWILDHPDHGAARLWYYPINGSAPQVQVLNTASLVDPGADDLDLGEIRAYDLAYQPNPSKDGGDSSIGTLVVVDSTGRQAFALTVRSLTPLTLYLERHYYPLRHSRPVSLIADWASGDVYYQQLREPSGEVSGEVSGESLRHRWLPIRALPRQRYELQETLILPILDGKDPDCVWHRLCLDACLPPNTTIQIEAQAAEQPEALTWATRYRQPSLYRRPSSELPYSSLWGTEELSDHTGTWELLFQDVRGRYLQLRLTLIGNGRTTPLLRALRAHYPRFSYLQEYLPAVYQQDAVSASFLERFLANPEGILTYLEGLIAQMQTLLDVHTAPAEALDWLASWIGLALDPGWNDHQRRLLIAQAPYFFQRRGTPVGLLQAILLTLYPDSGASIFHDRIAATLYPTVRIVERFLTRLPQETAIADPTDERQPPRLIPSPETKSRAHRFTVMVPTNVTATTHALIERIVALEKPAHTAFTLQPYWALFRVGDVRLGLDTVLGQGGQFELFRLGESALDAAALGTTFPYSLTNRTVISR